MKQLCSGCPREALWPPSSLRKHHCCWKCYEQCEQAADVLVHTKECDEYHNRQVGGSK